MIGKTSISLFIGIITLSASSAQEIDNYTLFLRQEIVSEMKASEEGNLLAVGFSKSKKLNIYDAKTLKLIYSYSIPEEVPLKNGETNDKLTGELSELYFFKENYFFAIDRSGYILHLNLINEQVTWYETNDSGNSDFKYDWKGLYLNETEICIVNSKAKKQWIINTRDGTVSPPEEFNDNPLIINKNLIYNIEMKVPEFIRFEARDFNSGKLLSDIIITDLNANDKYNFSANVSDNNKYLLVNLYTSSSIYDLKTEERIFYKSKSGAYPPNAFLAEGVAAFGDVGNQFSIYDFLNDEFLGSVKHYSPVITKNREHLFVFRSMEVNDSSIGILGSIPLDALIDSHGKNSVNLYKDLDNKTMEELRRMK